MVGSVFDYDRSVHVHVVALSGILHACLIGALERWSLDSMPNPKPIPLHAQDKHPNINTHTPPSLVDSALRLLRRLYHSLPVPVFAPAALGGYTATSKPPVQSHSHPRYFTTLRLL